MPIADVLVTALAPALSRSLLGLWTEENGVGRASGETVISVLEKLLPDILVRRRGERQFQAVGERIAEQLVPLISHNRLSEDRQEEVVRKVAETLSRGSLTTALLIETNFEPKTIADRFTAQYNFATVGLDDLESAIYTRVLRESLAQIIDVCAVLPGFTEQTIAEILRRETVLIEAVEKVAIDVQRIRDDTETSNPEAETAEFEETFRRAIVRKYDNMELFGIDLAAGAQRYPLSVAYVTLSLTQTSTAADPSDTSDSTSNRIDDDERTVASAEEVLKSGHRLLIRGDAGSGKTTLLRWIAVNAARNSFPAYLREWNELVPFFIPLRQFTDKELPSPDQFVSLTVSTLAESPPPGWLKKQLVLGRAILLIDGLDELPQIQRPAVRQWISDIVETYPETYVVLTSRPAAVSEGWLSSASFADAELQPMELPDIYEFIDHWHEAVAERFQSLDGIATAQQLATHMKDVVETNRALRNLATSPLLCAALCALHRTRHQQLPTDRVELYEACFYMLLDRRDRERKVLVNVSDYPNLTYRQKRVILEDLAYAMMRNSMTMMDVDQVDRQIQRKIAGMERIPTSAPAPAIRRFLVERSGVVREPIARKIDFTHKTFQEFLCAKALMESEDVGFLLDKATDDQWYEVITLAAGMGSARSVNELVSGLIQRGDAQILFKQQLHLLAVACLETAVEMDPAVKSALLERLRDLIPPQNITEARAIASAGELGIPFLQSQSTFKSPEAAAAVRALGLIGTARALDALATYVKDTRQLVVRELLRAATTVQDYNEYVTKVLSRLRIQTLRTGKEYPLALIGEITSLREVDLIVSAYEENLIPLAALRSLRIMNLTGGYRVTSLSPLSELKELRTLRIKWFSDVPDLEALAALRELVDLSLTDLAAVTDIGPIGHLTRLIRLGLSGLKAEDLTPLQSLTSLQDLRLSHIRTSSFSFLRDLPELKSLSITGMQGLDLLDVSALASLTHLTLSNVGNIALAPIADAHQLTSLWLENHPTKDVEFVRDSPYLHFVVLSNCNNLANIEALTTLSYLRTIRLRNCNAIRDLSPLQSLSGRRQIVLSRSMASHVHIPESLQSQIRYIG